MLSNIIVLVFGIYFAEILVYATRTAVSYWAIKRYQKARAEAFLQRVPKLEDYREDSLSVN